VEIDEELIYGGRRWIVRGFARLGTSESQVSLQDAQTGEWVTMPLAQVEQGQQRADARGDPYE
jgi:hypothetical protein